MSATHVVKGSKVHTLIVHDGVRCTTPIHELNLIRYLIQVLTRKPKLGGNGKVILSECSVTRKKEQEGLVVCSEDILGKWIIQKRMLIFTSLC